jgi:nitric oxide reductase NorE protein
VTATSPASISHPSVAPGAPPPRARAHIPGEVGVWIFILGDMVVFAWFFIVFMHQRARHVEAFNAAHKSLNLTFGGLNTMLLLTGSWFVVMAMHALRVNNQRTGQWFIRIAIVCGLGFVVNKFLEYHDKIVVGHPHEQADFFMYYFVLTGIHLVHLLIGLAVLTLMLRVAGKPVLGPRQFRTLESGASFWHLVDLLWLVLFALFYLVSG